MERVASLSATGRLRVMMAVAPAIFVIHFLEEGDSFVHWFNAHVARGITPELFWSVNVTALAITLAVAGLSWAAPSGGTDGVAFSWLSFLFGANAALHIAGALHDRQYVPGLATAVLLYAPFYVALTRAVLRERRVRPDLLLVLGILSALPMLVHGYLIIFRGDRLF